MPVAIPDTNIAVTLYTLNRHCKTKPDLEETLKRVRDIGYRAVQISGIGPIPPEDVGALLEKYGLYCCATHEKLDDLKKDTAAVAAKLKCYGCMFTAIGAPGGGYWSSEGVLRLARELDAIALALKQHGVGFGYHNHAGEFHKFTAKTFLEEVFDNAPNLLGELDTFWVQHGGASPARWIRRLKNRMPVVHFKDMTVANPAKEKNAIRDTEIGNGNLDWADIIAACRESGVRWFVVEQEDYAETDDIFASIRRSFENMRAMGIS